MTHDSDATLVDVATYATIEGAEMAASHLVELGYEPSAVAIAPRNFRKMSDDPGAHRVISTVQAGAAIGALLSAIVAMVVFVRPSAAVAVVLLAVVGALVGVVVGAVGGLVSAVRRRRTPYLVHEEHLRPSAYAIAVLDGPDEARHRLAKWWDPGAVPARWEMSR
jgi:hypothetical protein